MTGKLSEEIDTRWDLPFHLFKWKKLFKHNLHPPSGHHVGILKLKKIYTYMLLLH
jgi:hypothetical protein